MKYVLRKINGVWRAVAVGVLLVGGTVAIDQTAPKAEAALSTNDFADAAADATVIGQAGKSTHDNLIKYAVGVGLFGMAWAWFRKRAK